MPTTVQLVKLSALAQIQAGLEATVAASAAAALNSQNAAAASASTALNAQATEYLGGIAGNAVPATASLKGQYYLITSAGTSQSVTWAIGDKAVYNGTSGSWSRITGFFAASNSYAAGIGATRAWGGYLCSDGATPNRAQVQTPGARGNLAGAPLASWVGWVDVPLLPPAANTHIAVIGESVAPNFGGDRRLQIALRADGAMELATISPGGFLSCGWTGFTANFGGRRIWLEVRFAQGTAAPVVRLDGADVTAAFNSAGTGAHWLDSRFNYTHHVTGLHWPAGTAPLGCWLNAHLTDDESEQWRLTGRPPAWVAFGGHCAAIASPGAFLVTANGNGSAASAAGITVTATASPGRFSSGSDIRLQAGAYYEVQYTSDFAGAGCSLYRFAVGTFSANEVASVIGANRVILFCSVSTSLGRVSWTLSNGSVMTVSNFSIRQIGALSLPAVQPIAVVDDVTALGGNHARLVGMAPITERRDWRIVNMTTSSGSSYIQLLGGALFAEPERHRIDSWVINKPSAGNATVSLSQSNSGGTYASAITATGAARTEVTLATRFPASGQPNLWASSSTNDPITHTITGHRIGA